MVDAISKVCPNSFAFVRQLRNIPTWMPCILIHNVYVVGTIQLQSNLHNPAGYVMCNRNGLSWDQDGTNHYKDRGILICPMHHMPLRGAPLICHAPSGLLCNDDVEWGSISPVDPAGIVQGSGCVPLKHSEKAWYGRGRMWVLRPRGLSTALCP